MSVSAVQGARELSAEEGLSVIGRGKHPKTIARMLMEGRSVVVFGALGSGKSHLADAVTGYLRADGSEPLRLRGTASARATALGALGNSSDPVLNAAIGTITHARPSVLLDYLAARFASVTPVVQVDDAQFLDPQTAEWLTRLSADGALSLFLTSAPVNSINPQDFDPESIRLINGLWIEGRAERVDLEPLTMDDTDKLIVAFAPGQVFDAVTRATIFEHSGGSPLLVRELTAEALRNRLVLEDHDVLSSGNNPVTGRIADLLSHQLRSLSPSELHGLAVMGKVGALPYPRSLAIFSPNEVRSLLGRGFLRRTSDDLVSSHSLFASAAAAMSEPADLRDATVRLGRILWDESGTDRALTANEAVVVAECWACTGTIPSIEADVTAEGMSSVFVSASRRCRERYVFDMAHDFARRAHEVSPTVSSATELARTLTALGRMDDALQVLREWESHISTATDGILLVRCWTGVALPMRNNAAALADLADRVRTWIPGNTLLEGEADYVDLLRINRSSCRDNVLALSEAITANVEFDDGIRGRAAMHTGIELAGRGETEKGMARVKASLALLASPTRVRVVEQDMDDTSELESFVGLSIIRQVRGVDMDVTATEAGHRINQAVQAQDYASLGLLSVVASLIANFRGDYAMEAAELSKAEARFQRSDPGAWLPWAQVMHAGALAHGGSFDNAMRKLNQAQTTGINRGAGDMFARLVQRTENEIALLSGRVAQADLTPVAAAADADGPVMHVQRLYEMFELGEPAAAVVDALETSAAQTDSPYLDFVAERVRALTNQDAAKLDDVASRFASIGAFGQACATSEDAASLHSHSGNRAAAAASKLHAEHYGDARRSGHLAATPDPASSAANRLTGRENEIAQLAARGLSNRDIARALYLSVRTVESHLYQARLKLGAPSRRDLGVILQIDKQ
ncbi:LuxR family transcriptional regulator [Glaciihabitans sp. dw_435]|uniref:helix-turn-helix transcriptional regulator n=1 Tax=Glaciihabitans sp. dw_435 TaxID=2720081 RepID=UPI0023DF2049|nr:LuxR C-terminal-related transcriptional regulator [Glaciihabitans sp. dw_435]